MPDMSSKSSVKSDSYGLQEVEEPVERVRQLSQTASSVAVDDSVPIKRYWRSGKELLRMATIYREEQSLDKAFILYMKYMTLFVELIPQHIDYKNSEPNEKSLTKSNCKQIFPIAEQLKSQLLDKYRKEYELYLELKKRRQLEDEKRSEEQRQQLMRRREEEKAKELEELQTKLNKQIEERKERTDLFVPNISTNQTPKLAFGLSDNDMTGEDSIPMFDRSTKPSLLTFNDRIDSLRKLIIPRKLIDLFLSSALKNTRNNTETCAILAGKLGHNAFTITHVIVPKQRGTADSCQTDNEEEVFLIQDKYELLTLGWIHTHPTQSAFMSSIDLHTHCSYQLMLGEAIAIVCAPKLEQIGVFSLTDPYGLQLIASCRLSGFHPHPTEPPIYEQSSHVSFENTIGVELIDLR